jgi:uncharacterized protein CbrC (UPF0167 family)
MAEHTKRQKWMAQVCASCALCKYARRKQKGAVYRMVKLESKICPFCRAYERVHGKKAYDLDESRLKE